MTNGEPGNRKKWFDYADEHKTGFVLNVIQLVVASLLIIIQDGVWKIVDKATDVDVVISKARITFATTVIAAAFMILPFVLSFTRFVFGWPSNQNDQNIQMPGNYGGASRLAQPQPDRVSCAQRPKLISMCNIIYKDVLLCHE